MATILRERGIYVTPDGHPVIACNSIGNSGGGALYTRAEWEAWDNADLEWLPSGSVTQLGQPAGYDIQQLRDTGETVAD